MDRYTVLVLGLAFAGALQRLLRDDVKAFPTLKAPWRGLVTAVLTLLVVPGLDAVVNGASLQQALITGVVAIVPVVANLLASSAKAAAKAATVACALLFVGATSTGCAGLQTAHKWADSAQGYMDDAQLKLGELSAEVRAALAVIPDVPPEAKAEIEKAIAACDKALAAAIVASKGVSDLTDEQNLLGIFGDFVKAFDLLSDAASPYLGRANGKRLAGAVPAKIEPAVVALAHRKAAAK